MNIREIRKQSGLTLEEVAESLDVAHSTVLRWEKAETSPPMKKLEALASLFKVTLAQLIDSPGSSTPPLPSNVVAIGRQPNMDAVTTVPEIDVRAGMGGGGEASVDYWHDENGNSFPRDAVKEQWQFPTEHIRVKLSTPPEKAVIIEVEGDSMSPTLHSGDHVMINTADTRPSPPGIFAINDGLGLVVKRLEFIPHSEPMTCRVSSDNKHHSEYERSAEELQVIGRVVWFGRKV
ncbi:XRE family transcriptional regulator [Kiloniella antarctica]|uniref:XRE family transcriptional regulator n=1 Tax=Kiloniella antarctica TaxID=1550907 RepID=A0ABW5BKB9_9PROT